MAQVNKELCNEIKNGIFYYYPKNSADKCAIIREGNLQKETRVTPGDTIMWKVLWLNDCTYSLKFISSNALIPIDNLKILKKEALIYKINSVQTSYYTFEGYLGTESSTPFQKDTIWIDEKTNIKSNELFLALNEKTTKSSFRFKPQERFAIVNIYRPQKIANSLGSYLVFFDDNLMWVARNNSGVSFKIFKEGKYKLRSNLFKDESSVDIDIKFGNIYYVKSIIHWGISSRLYNFKLDMKVIAEEAGEPEFEGVKLR